MEQRSAKPMEYARILPALRVTDLDRAVGFFTGLFGFEVVWRTGGGCGADGAPEPGTGETAMLQAGEVSLMLSTGEHLGKAPAFTGVLYFQMGGWRSCTGRSRARSILPGTWRRCLMAPWSSP